MMRKIALAGAVAVLCLAGSVWNPAAAEDAHAVYPYETGVQLQDPAQAPAPEAVLPPAADTTTAAPATPAAPDEGALSPMTMEETGVPHAAESHAAPADAGHGGGHGESSAGLPQLDVSTFPGQLFWLAVTFGIMYLVFSRKSLPEISSVLERRNRHIESDLETAQKLKEEAESVRSGYESSLGHAKSESAKILHDVQNAIKAMAEKRGNDFRARAEQDIAALEKKLDSLKLSVMDDMNIVAAETAREAANKIVGIQTDLEQAKTVVKALNIPAAKAA